ncbi:hypothetical protein NX059_006454 [Plenodomus lindquistii]|nr:hypothetical protein NX059_006454 [Plenodomus lindquistii]
MVLTIESPEDILIVEEDEVVQMSTIVQITKSVADPDPTHPDIDRSDTCTFDSQNELCTSNILLHRRLAILGRERHFHTFLNLRDGHCGVLPVVVSNAVKILEYGYHAQCFHAMCQHLRNLFQDDRGFAPYILEMFSSRVFGIYDASTTQGLAIITVLVQDSLEEQPPTDIQVTNTLGGTRDISLDGHGGLYDFLVHIMQIEIACKENREELADIPRLEGLDPRTYFQSFEIGLRRAVEVKSCAPPLAIEKIIQTSKELVVMDRREARYNDQDPGPPPNNQVLEDTIRRLYGGPQAMLPLLRPPWQTTYDRIVDGELGVPPAHQDTFLHIWRRSYMIAEQEISKLPEHMHATATANLHLLWQIIAIRNTPRYRDTYEQAKALVSWTQLWEFSGFYIKRRYPQIPDGTGQVVLHTRSGTCYRYGIKEIQKWGAMRHEELQLLFALSRGVHPEEWVPIPLDIQYKP